LKFSLHLIRETAKGSYFEEKAYPADDAWAATDPTSIACEATVVLASVYNVGDCRIGDLLQDDAFFMKVRVDQSVTSEIIFHPFLRDFRAISGQICVKSLIKDITGATVHVKVVLSVDNPVRSFGIDIALADVPRLIFWSRYYCFDDMGGEAIICIKKHHMAGMTRTNMIEPREVFPPFIQSYQFQISDDVGKILRRRRDIDDEKFDMRVGARQGRYLVADDGDRKVLVGLCFDRPERALQECEHHGHRLDGRGMTKTGNKGKHRESIFCMS